MRIWSRALIGGAGAAGQATPALHEQTRPGLDRSTGDRDRRAWRRSSGKSPSASTASSRRPGLQWLSARAGRATRRRRAKPRPRTRPQGQAQPAADSRWGGGGAASRPYSDQKSALVHRPPPQRPPSGPMISAQRPTDAVPPGAATRAPRRPHDDQHSRCRAGRATKRIGAGRNSAIPPLAGLKRNKRAAEFGHRLAQTRAAVWYRAAAPT